MGRLIRTNGRATVTKIATAHLRYAKELLWTHKPWSRWDSAEDAWQNVTLSADSQFELQLSNGRVRICCKQHRSMAPSCLLFFFFLFTFSPFTVQIVWSPKCNAMQTTDSASYILVQKILPIMQLLLCIISHKAEGGNDKIFFHTRKSCNIICYSASWPYLVKADKAMGLIDVRNHQAIPSPSPYRE